ncbi:MAG: patatin-like phospholipase family protein [SAR324 cluster bacterium]|nr:patatin-like phospholipase family protein [SAR324 cluster bacterium]
MGFKIALALGGGAARGMAHLGVIKALTEAKIPIHIITGTSIGSIIGASYASHPNINDTIRQIRGYINSSDFNQAKLRFIKEGEKERRASYLDQFKKFLADSYFFAISSTQTSFISEEAFRGNLEHILPKIRVEDCEIEFGMVLANLDTGEKKYVTRGDLMDNVVASSSIPGIFPPIKMGKDYFIDGSWVDPIPVDLALEMGADFVIAVDVSPKMSKETQELTGLTVNLRAAEATRLALKNSCASHAHFTITVDIMDLHWADFLQLDHCVAKGEEIANRILPDLKRELFWARLRSFFLPW